MRMVAVCRRFVLGFNIKNPKIPTSNINYSREILLLHQEQILRTINYYHTYKSYKAKGNHHERLSTQHACLLSMIKKLKNYSVKYGKNMLEELATTTILSLSHYYILFWGCIVEHTTFYAVVLNYV